MFKHSSQHSGLKTAFCPVGNERLGYLVENEVSTFLCGDCGFIYTWDTAGKLLTPVKFEEVRKKKSCTCVSCQDRDNRKKTDKG